MNRNTVILIVILVVLAAIGVAVYNRHAVQAPTTASSTYQGPTSDTPDSIDHDLQGIDTGAGLDADIKATDKDIQQL